MPTLQKTFHDLHKGPALLILPNVWDAGSSALFESLGAKAIATSSAAVAWALGHADGNVLPPEKLAALVKGITDCIKVPLSVDVEGGYTDDPKKISQKLKPIFEAGAVGINIEDGDSDPELLVRKIEQVQKTADRLGINLFINARTDVYLKEIGTSESRIPETISRAEKYRNAGADGLFVPALTSAPAVKAIAAEIKLPLNVMARPELPPAKELSKLGVRRLSAGGAIAQVLWNHAAELAKNFLKTGDSRPITKNGMPYADMQKLFCS